MKWIFEFYLRIKGWPFNVGTIHSFCNMSYTTDELVICLSEGVMPPSIKSWCDCVKIVAAKKDNGKFESLVSINDQAGSLVFHDRAKFSEYIEFVG